MSGRKAQLKMLLGCSCMVLMVTLSGCGNSTGNNKGKETSQQTSVQSASGSEDAANSSVQSASDQKDAEDSSESAGKESTETQSTTGSGIFGSFQTQTIQGSQVSDAIFAGAKLTMVNIWATYCSPCIGEMPELSKLNSEYASQGFQVVGMISDVSQPKDQTALSVIKKTGADYTHILLNQELYNNYVNQVQAVPTTILVDSNGKQVGETYVGAQDQDSWSAIIKAALKEVTDKEKKK